jgi:hypothetical protein
LPIESSFFVEAIRSALTAKGEAVVKAVVLWERAPDSDWYAGHADLCRKVPGVTFRAGPIFGTPGGDSEYAQYAEFEFPDRETFNRGMGSDEMKAAVEDGQTQGIPFHVYFVDVG